MAIDCGDQTTVSCASLHKIAPSFTKDPVEKKQIPLDPAASELSEDVSLDAKELIRALTDESNEIESSNNLDSSAGVDGIINKILASHPVSLLDSEGSELFE